MTGKMYHPEDKHPEPYQQDLNPEANVGQNDARAPRPGKVTSRTAFDVKEIHQRLPAFDDDELRKITVLPAGRRLEQGATYIDLQESDPHEFTARADMESGPGNWYVPKSEVDYPIWNRLIGIKDPARLDQDGHSEG